MLSPLTGLARTVGYVLRSPAEPRLAIAGGDMTGVHVLQGRSEPGAYHIGGAGIVADEPVIRSLGETVERYSQFVSAVGGRRRVELASLRAISARGVRYTGADKLRFFSERQLAAEGFPLQPLGEDDPLGWVSARSLIDGEPTVVPAQLALVGYTPDRGGGEPWIYPGMTTGTAAHTDRTEALRSALLELTQIDSVIGHWYSSAAAPRIRFDARTEPLRRLLARAIPRAHPEPEFYWLANADLGALTVACLLRQPEGKVPVHVVGIAAETRLDRAMYKALLEAAGVLQLAKLDLVTRAIAERGGEEDPGPASAIDPAAIFDLDSNVTWHALPENRDSVERKFGRQTEVAASELPADSDASPAEEVRALIGSYHDSGKELLALDLTDDAIAALGFVSMRVWSPDTLSICFPSAPPEEHPRFRAYGGVVNRDPHPYP